MAVTNPSSEPETSIPDTPGTAVRPAAGKKGEGERIEFSRARQTMTRRIAESKAIIPHIYLQLTVAMDAAEALRDELRSGSDDPVPTVSDLVIRSLALTLAEHPRVNSSYRDGGIELHPRINLGFAVDTDDGSLTPVISDAGDRTLGEIGTETRRLAARARSGELTPPEQAGATFSMSSLGMLGITASFPVVNPGQAAKLAVGAIVTRPVVRDGKVVPGREMELTLCCDHRILHGGEAARFLTAVGDRLERPEELIG